MFTTNNLDKKNKQNANFDNRTSVNFRFSQKSNHHEDYKDLIMEVSELDEDESWESGSGAQLEIQMKLKVNNVSMEAGFGDETEAEEHKYGMSNADSDLQYNNKYFETQKEKKRFITYSNLTRLSIRKIIKKIEAKCHSALIDKLNSP